MRRTMVFASGTLILLAMLASAAGPAAAQGGHRLGGAVLPLAPDPRRCKVAPRPLGEVKSMWQAANADSNATNAPAPDQSVDGTPVDSDTLAAISDAVVQELACADNANDGLRDAALSTDARLSDMLLGLSQDEFANTYTTDPTASQPEDWTILYSLDNVQMLPDGTVSVTLQVISPGVRAVPGLHDPGARRRWRLARGCQGRGRQQPLPGQQPRRARPVAWRRPTQPTGRA